MFDLIGLGVDKLSIYFNRMSSQKASAKLGTAIRVNQVRRIKNLLKTGLVDPDAPIGLSKGGLGWSIYEKDSPLGLAVSIRAMKVVRVLKAGGANVNRVSHRVVSFNGNRQEFDCIPIVSAASSGDTRMVRLLLELGADPSLKDGNGKTAYDHATENSFIDIKNLLAEALEKQAAAQVVVQTTPDGALADDCKVFSKPAVLKKRSATP